MGSNNRFRVQGEMVNTWTEWGGALQVCGGGLHSQPSACCTPALAPPCYSATCFMNIVSDKVCLHNKCVT